jgi:hypothetical protein
MQMLTGKRICVFAIFSGLMTHAVAGDAITQKQDAAVQSAEEVEQPLKMDEPMQGGMKKKGMLKGDVKTSAEKKDKKMQEILMKEEKSMPPKPQQEQ